MLLLKEILRGIRQEDLLNSENSYLRITRGFKKIELSIKSLNEEFKRLKPPEHRHKEFLFMLESAFPERPLQVAEFLEKVFLLPSNHNLIVGLRDLYSDIQALRKDGEEIINISRELDRIARENAEGVIRTSQIAILLFFPLFLIIGIGLLFFITNNVVNRLNLLIDLVEKTGKGDYSHIPVSPERDEVGILIRKFNDMENQLSRREEELQKKNMELLQSRKLAAIGTLASGVAHELNNPLNNIYISAQVLMREIGNTPSISIKETVDDILSQTLRVKGIVADLLEFARGKEPRLKEVLLNDIIMGAYRLVSTTNNTEGINFVLHFQPSHITINVDPEQMERVFVNLFLNAIDAMNGKGNLDVNIREKRESVIIKITDTGRGIPKDALEKIFEPFYTTKDKGTGLGLAIVFNIIKKHNGKIKVESEVNIGTTFTIILPALKHGSGLSNEI